MNFYKFPRISMNFKGKTFGFTLLELLIVIAITATLSVVGVGFYVNQQKAKILENTAQEIANYLRYTQQKSVSQEQGLQWGVHFENPSSGSDFYALYTGTTYSSSIETKYLPAGIEFQTPTPSTSTDVSFKKLTGLNYSEAEQEIIIRLTSNQIARVIRTTANGLITSGEGEKGYWKFNEGSGTMAFDSTIYKNTGTLYNSPTWKSGSDCLSGSCLSFDGISNYISVNAAPTTNVSTWTLEAWIKPANLSQLGLIYNGNDSGGYGFGVGNGAGSAGSKLQGLFGYVAWVDSGYTFPSANQWYHIVMTRDGTTTKFYVNGSQTSGTTTATPGAVQAKFSIGMQYDASNNPIRYFSGLIDEPRIYNRALSPAEILQHYNSR